MALDMLLRRGSRSQAKEEHWIPLSDLMTGLMMMFMLIAIIFMLKVEADSQKVKDVARIYDEMRTDLYKDLREEFKEDLPRWGAELDKNLALRFKSPDVLFDSNRSDLKPGFIQILNDFFPRYVRILTSKKYRAAIEEIRIEGHTSTVWSGATSVSDAYFKNMELSQSRTRSVLQHVLSEGKVASEQDWLKTHLTANGLSSSKPILKPSGAEDMIKSQRVEFKVRTNADERIAAILRTAEQ